MPESTTAPAREPQASDNADSQHPDQQAHPIARVPAAIFLLFVLAACSLVYLPGLPGPFLLDDFENIPNAALEHFNWASIAELAPGNASGLFGRPLPVITFGLNHYFTGPESVGFKAVNLTLHLANGLLIYWLAQRVLQLAGHAGKTHCRRLQYAAALIAAAWLLHPLQVSTVLYVVQRMTLMATFFSLLALLSYLTARQKMGRPGTHYLLFLMLSFVFMLLACLCKENGVLVALYIGVLEFTLLRWQVSIKRRQTLFRVTFFLLFSTGLLLGLTYFIQNSSYLLEGYNARDFSLSERLLTQTRVLTMHLMQIVLPDISGMSLYYDNYPVSRRLDVQTLLSMAVVLALLMTAVVARRHAPLLSLGVGIFLASHALESTFLPLELVFEHRNYLAVFGVLLPLVAYPMIWLQHDKAARAGAVFMAVVLLVYGMQTHARSREWASALSHDSTAVTVKPDSIRASAALSLTLARSGRVDLAVREMKRIGTVHPTAGYPALQLVQLQAMQNKLTKPAWQHALDVISTGTITNDVASVLGTLQTNHLKGVQPEPTRDELIDLFTRAAGNANKQMSNSIQGIMRSRQSRLLIENGQLPAALESAKAAHRLYPQDARIHWQFIELLAATDQLAVARQHVDRFLIAQPAYAQRHTVRIERVEKRLQTLTSASQMDD